MQWEMASSPVSLSRSGYPAGSYPAFSRTRKLPHVFTERKPSWPGVRTRLLGKEPRAPATGFTHPPGRQAAEGRQVTTTDRDRERQRPASPTLQAGWPPRAVKSPHGQGPRAPATGFTYPPGRQAAEGRQATTASGSGQRGRVPEVERTPRRNPCSHTGSIRLALACTFTGRSLRIHNNGLALEAVTLHNWQLRVFSKPPVRERQLAKVERRAAPILQPPHIHADTAKANGWVHSGIFAPQRRNEPLRWADWFIRMAAAPGDAPDDVLSPL